MDHTPSATAAADQAQAAFDQARDQAADVLEKYTGHPPQARQGITDGTPEARILDHFLDWLRDVGDECPHRPLRQPHAYWAAVAPILSCAWCFRQLNEILKAIPHQPTLCDLCLQPRTSSQPWLPRVMVLGGYVGSDGTPLAAITIVYILCPGCAA